MKKLLVLISFLSLAWMVSAQQELLLTQQFYSRINKNPAGIGNVEDIDVFLLGHFQYAGLDDSPKTFVLNGHTYVDKLNSGFGFTASYDKLAAARSFTNIKVDYSYGLRFNDDMMLSLGLGFGVLVSQIDFGKYTVENPTELDALSDEDGTEAKPDMDFGAEFTLQDRLLVGASVTHLISGKTSTFTPGQHIYVYARYMIPLTEQWDLAPMLNYVHHKKTNVLEVNVSAAYNRFVWAGLTWHPDMSDGFSSNPLAINIGAEFKRFRVGYMFDLSLGNVNDLAKTSHEFMVSYSIQRKKTATISADGDFFE